TIPAGVSGHELPHTLGPSPRDSQGVEATLDHRGVGQLLGEITAPQDRSDHSQVAAGPTHPERDEVTTLTGEAIEKELHLGIERYGVRLGGNDPPTAARLGE